LKGALILAIALASTAAPLQAAEWRVGTGIFMLSEGGFDAHLGGRPEESHWQFGVRALRYTIDWQYAGSSFSRTTTTMVGPTLNYFFRPQERGSWYLGASLLHWKQHVRSLTTGASGADETTAPFFGGGYTGRIMESGYFNLGLFLSSVKLGTQTSTADGEQTTGADLQLQLGLAF
jgi:hypothetical protein